MATVEKRPLTDEERAEAARLRTAWAQYKDEHPGATQQWLGAASELGSQGLIGQYLRGIIPLNLKALISICAQIGAKAEEISPRLMKPFTDFNQARTEPETYAASEKLTAAVSEYEGETNPASRPAQEALNTVQGQKLAMFKAELAKAEREGLLSEEKLDLLLGILRLTDKTSSPQRHTKSRILVEPARGQSGDIRRKGTR
ncbi:hypothetical protein SB379_19830 [Burkholderia multivorans]|uniref:hypothetical protein n=1 Tax=Burkholderia multivorans TaxID=87883 RepID=UPI001C216C64|nr:hypothetical protein [Burkholderia multivorans]MBU9351713.1 hypothetical protein [Burkholderia multivorans]MBU9394932.1 hypothetical protein [Burkholderia multivorans]MEB2511291.1 hypothetical protein [Burkholderia multivorans]MEB2523726.1 hypothetical protein [Burkholderia multivorans]MEB2575655.1 hypothetical protein [Burkholderia multivorans]